MDENLGRYKYALDAAINDSHPSNFRSNFNLTCWFSLGSSRPSLNTRPKTPANTQHSNHFCHWILRSDHSPFNKICVELGPKRQPNLVESPKKIRFHFLVPHTTSTRRTWAAASTLPRASSSRPVRRPLAAGRRSPTSPFRPEATGRAPLNSLSILDPKPLFQRFCSFRGSGERDGSPIYFGPSDTGFSLSPVVHLDASP